MKLLVSKGYAKEKEDNIDLKCGCDCTCCQKRHSQYWVNKQGALTTSRIYVAKHLHLQGEKLEDYLRFNFYDLWDKFDVLQIG